MFPEITNSAVPSDSWPVTWALVPLKISQGSVHLCTKQSQLCTEPARAQQASDGKLVGSGRVQTPAAG